MRTRSSNPLRYSVAALAVIFATGVISAPSSGEFEIRRTTIDGGGGESQGGDFILRGSLGQPDAALRQSGGDFVLQGGFWTQAEPGSSFDIIFLDGFE